LKKTIKNIVVFASGSGSNAIKIYEYFQKIKALILRLFIVTKNPPQLFKNFKILESKQLFSKKISWKTEVF
jgi:folate-dependent phosphoribosylglycinamide formyltransferase PurN